MAKEERLKEELPVDCGILSGPSSRIYKVTASAACVNCGHAPCPCCEVVCDVMVPDPNDPDESTTCDCMDRGSCTYSVPMEFRFKFLGVEDNEDDEPRSTPETGRIYSLAEYEALEHGGDGGGKHDDRPASP